MEEVHAQVPSTAAKTLDLPTPNKLSKVKERIRYLQEHNIKLQEKLKDIPQLEHGELQQQIVVA